MAIDPVVNGKFTRLNGENYRDAFNIQFVSHPVPWSEATFADCLTTPYFAWSLSSKEMASKDKARKDVSSKDVAIKDEVVGYYVILLVAGEATLMDIGVAPQARRKGYGRQLLEHAIEQSVAKGADQMWLEVRQSNASAQRLYQRYGFELIEQRKGYYPTAEGREDALIMRLELPQNSSASG